MVEKKLADMIKEKFPKELSNFYKKSPKRIYFDVKPGDIPAICEYLFKDLDSRFVIATGTDTPGGIEVLYHFSFDRKNVLVSIRTLLQGEKPEIESISSIIKGAEWIEREIHELLGVNFKNHPDLRHLLLDEDWPEGNYPYRSSRR